MILVTLVHFHVYSVENVTKLQIFYCSCFSIYRIFIQTSFKVKWRGGVTIRLLTTLSLTTTTLTALATLLQRLKYHHHHERMQTKNDIMKTVTVVFYLNTNSQDDLSLVDSLKTCLMILLLQLIVPGASNHINHIRALIIPFSIRHWLRLVTAVRICLISQYFLNCSVSDRMDS